MTSLTQTHGQVVSSSDREAVAHEFMCLMYHDLEGGSRICCPASHKRYVVPAAAFREQMVCLKSLGFTASTVSHARQARHNMVAITFDDGSRSDIDIAAPVLAELRSAATFYVVTGWLGTAGHLDWGDLKEIVSQGSEIGSHGVTHTYLPGISSSRLRQELWESKDCIEQRIGAPVLHFSCPFGGYTPAVLAAAAEAGYATIANDRIGPNNSGDSVLNRVVIRRTTSLRTFKRISAGEVPIYQRARQTVLSGIKGVLGYSAYSLLSRFGRSGW